jgi:predicted regulator of Ras-like GTPase activity (Roadblock/LC7/MglB family)
MLWPRRLREIDSEQQEGRVREFLSALREKLPGIRALFVLSADGELLDCAAVDPGIDVSVFASEYATLLRIVERTSMDTGMGDFEEQILIHSSSQIVVRRLPRNRFVVCVCSPSEQLGRLRYELRRCLLYSTLSNL